MPIKEQIEKDAITALKNKDNSLAVLRMIKAAIHNEEISQGKDLKDADIVVLLQKEMKKRQESIESFKKGNRPELAEKESAEITIIEKYLPELMPEAEIIEIVKKAITDVNASSPADMGKVMAKIMPELKGKADPAQVSEIVKLELSK